MKKRYPSLIIPSEKSIFLNKVGMIGALCIKNACIVLSEVFPQSPEVYIRVLL